MDRRNALLLLALAIELLAFGAMAALGDLRVHVFGFLALFIVAVISFVCAFRLSRENASLASIVLIAVGLRVPLLFTEPTLSDDVWRYLHDGRAQLAGLSPYAYAPADARTAPFRGAEFKRINHSELVTIYPPAAQLTFALNALLGSSLLVWRLVLVAAELITLVALARLLRHGGLGARNLALYAWHPLAVVEVAGSAHLEPVGIALLLTGVWAGIQNRAVLGGVLLGLSTAAKLVSAPLVLVTTLLGKRRLLAAASATLIILYALYWRGAAPFGSLATFAVNWEGNASIYSILAILTDGHRARILAATFLVCVMLVIRSTQFHDEDKMAACMLAILLLSPIAHPWYLLWLLAFTPMITRAWLRGTALIWTMTVPLAYLPGDFRLVEYAPVYMILLISAFTAARRGSLREIWRPSAERTQRIPT